MALHEVKLCLLGESGVGKTCIVNRFVSDVFSDKEPLTVGAAFSTRTISIGDHSILFQIWDTAGQEKYRGLAPMYYRGAVAAIVAYDITNQRSFVEMQSWIQELRQLGPPNLVLAITGNKVDMEDSRQVSKAKGEEYARSVQALFKECSAKEDINISEVFTSIAEQIPLDRLSVEAPKMGTIQLNRKTNEDHRCKC